MAQAPDMPPAEEPLIQALSAPAHWQAVDFISDLHLCEAMPRTYAAFAAHLAHTSADAVFILGDLFEVWVGDDMADLAFERDCLGVMRAASSRLHLGFMVGNRDFLAGARMLQLGGATGLSDPTLFNAWGRNVLLSHGDALCLADAPYQEFRAMVRSAAWQSTFLARPLADRMHIAAQIRQASQGRRQFDGASDADADVALALQWLQQSGAEVLVHGHTHRPGTNALALGRLRHVLSDWDLDQGQRAEVLRMTRAGFERMAPSGN